MVEYEEKVETRESEEIDMKDIVREFFPEDSLMMEFYNLGEELYTLEHKTREEGQDEVLGYGRETTYIIEDFLDHILSVVEE